MAVRIYGNRQIKTLTGHHTRPTSSRVREALFNIWQGRIDGCRWLDLCAGSGAMGAEALCRGASRVVGIEKAPKACAIIQENWEKVAQTPQVFQLMRGDIVRQLEKLVGQSFDLIYFDPPYASRLYMPVLEAIATHHLLAENGELAVEHDITHVLPDKVTSLVTSQNQLSSPSDNRFTMMTLASHRQKTYGSTSLTFYQHQ